MMKKIRRWLQILNCLTFLCLIVVVVVGMEGIEIETKFLMPSADRTGLSRWSKMKECPAGSVVTSYKFSIDTLTESRNEDNLLVSANTIAVIQGVALQCSTMGPWSLVVEKVIFDGPVDVRQSWSVSGKSKSGYINGFSFERWTNRRNQEDSDAEEEKEEIVGKWRFLFDDDSSLSNRPNELDGEQRREDVFCPNEYAICGFQVMRDPVLDNITKFKFKCCYHCIATEVNVVIYDFTNNGRTDVSHTVAKRIGLRSGDQHSDGWREDKTKRIEGDLGVEGSIALGNQYNPYYPSQSFKQSRQGGEGEGGQMPGGGGESPAPPPSGGGGSSGGGGNGGSQTAPPPSGGGGNSGGGSGGSLSPSSSGGGGQFSNLYLKARFDKKFGKSKTSGFNWQDTSFVLWDHQTDETDSLVCKALHRCVLKQLVGKCGKYQFNTPSFDFTSIPLRLDLLSNLGDDKTKDDTLKIEREGEIWIVIQNLLFTPRSGVWEELKLCPPGSIVTGQQIRFKKGYPFTGLNLKCSRINSTDQFIDVTTLSSGSGNGKTWYNSSGEALGCTFVQYSKKGLKWKTNFEIIFKGEESYLDVPSGAEDFKRSLVTCPEKFAVCGYQTMYDLEGRGQLCAIGFKCCYHCLPQEKTIVLESFTNAGYTDTIQTIRRIIGNNINREHSNTASNGTDLTDNSEGITPTGLQAGFASKFDRSNYGGFNWASTFNSFWTRHEEKTLTILCKARHLCVYRQLVGICNDVEIATPYTIKESFPLDGPQEMPPKIEEIAGSMMDYTSLMPTEMAGMRRNFKTSLKPLAEQTSVEDTMSPVEMPSPPREKWIIVRNLTMSESGGSGRWESSKLCAPGSFATAVSLHFQSSLRFRVSGVSLKCASLKKRKRSGVNFQTVMELTAGKNYYSGYPNGTTWFYLETPGGKPIVGFSFVEYKVGARSKFSVFHQAIFEGNEERLMYNSRVQFGPESLPTKYSIGCEKNFAVCGVKAMFDRTMNDVINSIAFKCCYYCWPKEKIVTLASFLNFDESDSIQSVKWTIGTQKIGQGGSDKVFIDSSSKYLNNNGVDRQDAELVSVVDLQPMFTSYFENASSILSIAKLGVHFNFADTSFSLWTVVENKSTEYTCKARRLCTFRQLILQCGEYQTSTPLIAKQSLMVEEGT